MLARIVKLTREPALEPDAVATMTTARIGIGAGRTSSGDAADCWRVLAKGCRATGCFRPSACRAWSFGRLLYIFVRTNPVTILRDGGKSQMKSIFFGASGYLLACIMGDAVAAPAQTEVAIFAVLTVSNDQSMRVLVSNVTASAEGTTPPCQVQVKFFGSDGSLVDEVAALQLKPGESRSVAVSHPANLLRASVGVDSDVDLSKACELKARVEVFDLQTGTTFVSVASDPSAGHFECASSSVPVSMNLEQDVTSALGRRRVSRRHHSRRR